MKNLLSTLLGIGMLGYFIYVIVLIFKSLFGSSSNFWNELSTHLFIIGGLILLMIIAYLYDKSKKKKQMKE